MFEMPETADDVGESTSVMTVLGIDPGMALLGYGLLADPEAPRAITYGVIQTPAQLPPERRLVLLYEEVRHLLAYWRPAVVVLEQLFFARNVTTAMAVGQARGVVLLACGQMALPVIEYTPAQVKQAIGGYGRAGKRQVQEMIKLLLGLPSVPQPDDAADALAIALCHCHQIRNPWAEATGQQRT
ncbi:MAG: crossover junction endodeoxyribonuclease RuvC [Thermomicrobium sp.]|nr:crossover junction endodeoxyribonuclease RuvC [Thermomicrobium sp.]MCS7246085.1 crossover junction endodeoxyribonuclease RuvC [Thermomicrobium sp.]MDW7981753.1 crossover junction endodeoxyribonuclease RuvC [Thermomicrobium sp.]